MYHTSIPRRTDSTRRYPLTHYAIGSKSTEDNENWSVSARLERLRSHFSSTQSPGRSVEAIVLVHQHGHPHVLCFHSGSAFFKFPGGSVEEGESDEQALQRILDRDLGAPSSHHHNSTSGSGEWKVAELVATWYRINFDNYMYPYLPPVYIPADDHVSVRSHLNDLTRVAYQEAQRNQTSLPH